LPACAGVALGIDRLLMAMTGSDRIAEVLAFDFARA
jgi:lysyl-tRNA synthetase class 2